MYKEMKNKLEACFSRGSSPKGCYGALPYMEENIGKINFDDDSDMSDMIDIILRALKLDENNIKFVEFLVSNGFDMNYKLSGDNCLLLKYIDDAQENGVLSLDVIKQRIALGADVCSETLDGDNVLSLLAGRDEQIAVYMAAFYDLKLLDKMDKYGATPLMYAAMRGYNRLAKMLIDRGFDVNATDNEQNNAIAYAMDAELPQIVELLIGAGAES